MWTARRESIASRRIIHHAIDYDGVPVSYGDVLMWWQSDVAFRAFFIGLLADVPFTAYRWETPALQASTTSQPFEFVILDSPELSAKSDAKAFAGHFAAAGFSTIVEFQNLGKDAVLVVPCPAGPHSAYCHLASFVRSAPPAQVHDLWQKVGAVMTRHLNSTPVWLSTAGAGVPWLHVRLDDRPKYYGYHPYRNVGT